MATFKRYRETESMSSLEFDCRERAWHKIQTRRGECDDENKSGMRLGEYNAYEGWRMDLYKRIYCWTVASCSTAKIAARFSSTRAWRRSRAAWKCWCQINAADSRDIRRTLFLTRRASIWSVRTFVRVFSALALWMYSMSTRLFLKTLPLDFW